MFLNILQSFGEYSEMVEYTPKKYRIVQFLEYTPKLWTVLTPGGGDPMKPEVPPVVALMCFCNICENA